MTWNQPILDLDRAMMDARHVGDCAASIFPPRTRAAALLRLTQAGDQLTAQRAARHGIDRRVDRFVTDLKGRLIGMHATQYAGNLFGRMARAQQALYQRPERAIHRQPGRTTWRGHQFACPGLPTVTR
jgi:hypothetical protein